MRAAATGIALGNAVCATSASCDAGHGARVHSEHEVQKLQQVTLDALNRT